MANTELTTECVERLERVVEQLDRSAAACSFCFQGLVPMEDGHNECDRFNASIIEEIKTLSELLSKILAESSPAKDRYKSD